MKRVPGYLFVLSSLCFSALAPIHGAEVSVAWFGQTKTQLDQQYEDIVRMVPALSQMPTGEVELEAKLKVLDRSYADVLSDLEKGDSLDRPSGSEWSVAVVNFLKWSRSAYPEFVRKCFARLKNGGSDSEQLKADLERLDEDFQTEQTRRLEPLKAMAKEIESKSVALPPGRVFGSDETEPRRSVEYKLGQLAAGLILVIVLGGGAIALKIKSMPKRTSHEKGMRAARAMRHRNDEDPY